MKFLVCTEECINKDAIKGEGGEKEGEKEDNLHMLLSIDGNPWIPDVDNIHILSEQ